MIPSDLVEDQDAEFYSEIVEVNDLYFGNFDVEDTEVKSDHNHDTDDNDSESDSDCDNANISHNLDNDSDLKEADKSEVSRHNPGIVFVKEYANSPEVEINVLRNQNCRFPHLDPELPAVIPPKGLDPARQWYLYEEVAPYCNNKDSCKKPDVTKPILKAEQSEEYDKKRKCSHCKSCGHTKSRGGIITCPKLL
ncbi:hypothetical protein KUTeg_022436 [Tegillarca granosa]|uniref:Uncharacterized protein n=1 Tax=Tegillarca granosa TaxID=220873 RepID=A0ABQ9EAK8_TEGGR|nr:hypothetical protein KUTeg_022436 [Tegillarca granosa]